jgi:hypothetical protein
MPEWSGRRKIGGVVGWIVVVTQMLKEQRGRWFHALGLRLGPLRNGARELAAMICRQAV